MQFMTRPRVGSKMTHKIFKRVMRSIIQRDGVGCMICGSTENLELDHIVPVSLGGQDVEENLQFLCNDCHSAKTSEENQQWHRSNKKQFSQTMQRVHYRSSTNGRFKSGDVIG